MTGGVLNAINTRLDAPTIAHILQHGEASIVIVDTEFSEVIRAAIELLSPLADQLAAMALMPPVRNPSEPACA